MTDTDDKIRLTQYSHGAGCGCKISPKILDSILASSRQFAVDPNLKVGNDSRDDAAVYDAGDGMGVVSTTDFFMPIVDDPFDFGRIAVTNAISDIYAMGGRPIMAIAVLGWPLDKLPPEVAGEVVDGGRQACSDAGIMLAGGHSIDAPEPIFGAAVTGLVKLDQLKRNDTAQAGCRLYLTKPLGIGILTTAEKKSLLKPEHQTLARDTMCQLNKLGQTLATSEAVAAMTDVTGFGLLGHLIEMCQGSGLSAEINPSRLPRLEGVDEYIQAEAVPGGTHRNFASYGQHVAEMTDEQKALLCDPQTSGGLLVAVKPELDDAFHQLVNSQGLSLQPFGQLVPGQPGLVSFTND